MGTVTNFLLCSVVVVIAQGGVRLEADRPFLRLGRYEEGVLKCCYTNNTPTTSTWFKLARNETLAQLVEPSSDNVMREETVSNRTCGILTLKSVDLNDTGLYQCFLKTSNSYYSHGTYLQVYIPLKKTINLRESTKNKILIAEGILLLLCVLAPTATLLCQSKKLNELEKKKMKKEEENIYQGLNLDDCCTTYDQIERSQAHGPYQDVCNIMEEEEDIQLEKP